MRTLDNRGMRIRPITGGLVCMEGATKGRDYRLLNDDSRVPPSAYCAAGHSEALPTSGAGAKQGYRGITPLYIIRTDQP